MAFIIIIIIFCLKQTIWDLSEINNHSKLLILSAKSNWFYVSENKHTFRVEDNAFLLNKI